MECTSACIQSLSAFRKQYPKHRAQEIESSICRAAKYIESIQRPDGSWCVISSTHHWVPCWILCIKFHVENLCNPNLPWYLFLLLMSIYTDLVMGFPTSVLLLTFKGWAVSHGWNRYGSWGVCFTYGTWFGIEGLLAAGRSYETSASIRSACDFLLSKQQASGGWGESYLSCQDKVVSKELLLFLVFKVLTPRIFFALTRHMNSLVWLWLKYAACYSVSVCINCCFSSRSTLAWKEINHTLWTRHGQCSLS